jgi:hypothetical protein
VKLWHVGFANGAVHMGQLRIMFGLNQNQNRFVALDQCREERPFFRIGIGSASYTVAITPPFIAVFLDQNSIEPYSCRKKLEVQVFTNYISTIYLVRDFFKDVRDFGLDSGYFALLHIN